MQAAFGYCEVLVGFSDSEKLRQSTRYILILLSFLPCALLAQEAEDPLLGTWQVVTTGGESRGRCGGPVNYGELEITDVEPGEKKSIYTGTVTAWLSWQRCLEVTKETTTARLVKRGSHISLSYGNEEWGSEMLVHEGNKITGIDSEGHDVEWVKPGELPLSISTAMVKQNIVTGMEKERVAEFKAQLVEAGAAEDEADRLVTELVTGLAGCVIDVAAVQAAIQRLPYEELLKIYDPISADEPNPRVVRRLDQMGVEARTRACFYEVADELDADVF